MLAKASFSKLLEYEQIENGVSRYLLLEKRCTKSEKYYFIKKKWEPKHFSPPVQDS